MVLLYAAVLLGCQGDASSVQRPGPPPGSTSTPSTPSTPSTSQPDALLPCVVDVHHDPSILAVFPGHEVGRSWVTSYADMWSRSADGADTMVASVPPVVDGAPRTVVETADGALWAVTHDRLFRRDPASAAGGEPSWEAVDTPGGWVRDVFVDDAGGVRVAFELMADMKLASLDLASGAWTDLVPWRSGSMGAFLPDGRLAAVIGDTVLALDGVGEETLVAPGDRIYGLAVGRDGTLVVERAGRFDVHDPLGAITSFEVSAVGMELVWVGGPDDVWVFVQDTPLLFHYDGTTVREIPWPDAPLPQGADYVTGAADGDGGLLVAGRTGIEWEGVAVHATDDGATLLDQRFRTERAVALTRDDVTGLPWMLGDQNVAAWEGADWASERWDHDNLGSTDVHFVVSDGQRLLARNGDLVVDDDGALERTDLEVTAVTTAAGVFTLYGLDDLGMPVRRVHDGDVVASDALSSLPEGSEVRFAGPRAAGGQWLGVATADGIGLWRDDGAEVEGVLDDIGMTATAMGRLGDRLWFLGEGQLGWTEAEAPGALTFLWAPEGTRTLSLLPDGRLLAQTFGDAVDAVQPTALYVGDGEGTWTRVFDDAMSGIALPGVQEGEPFVAPLLNGRTAVVSCP